MNEQEEEPGKFEKWLLNKFGEKAEKIVMGFTVCLSIVIAVALFMILPLFIADVIEKYVPGVTQSHVPVIEGIVKIIIFIGYLLLISLMKDIENVASSSRFHKRCGTSFLLIVMVISIIFFVLIRTDIVWLRYVIRLLLVPVIAGISYEFIRLAGKSENKFINLLSKPGLWMQKITTKEPTDDMIEVAIKAVEAVFDWKEYLKESGIEVEKKEETSLPKEYKQVIEGSGYNWKY